MQDKLGKSGNRIAKFLGVEKKFNGILLVKNLKDKRFKSKRVIVSQANLKDGTITISQEGLKEMKKDTTSYLTDMPNSKLKPIDETILHELLHIKSPEATEETIERRTYKIGKNPRLKRILANA